MFMRSHSNVGFERVRHPAIWPLEISDLWVQGATLWEWTEDGRFVSVLCQALDRWRRGVAPDRWNDAAPADVPGFDAVFLAGGRLEDRGWHAELSGFCSPVFVGEEPVFGGERGGLELLKAHGLSGWVADLGKSQLKISTSTWRGVFFRDWTRLLPAVETSRLQLPAQRRRLREFIALSMRKALAETGGGPRAMAFALPTRLDRDGTPGASSYAGMRGDRTLLRSALDQAGLPGVRLLVLNDAELVAWSAISDPRLSGFGKVLVLTLGSGIGAALINRAGEGASFEPN